MPSQVITSVENNFTKGLVTEFTGLNFPENAATDCSNVEFTIVGDVTRREGIDIEVNGTATAGTDNVGTSSYVWTNAGGDGNTKLLVRASGGILRFYVISSATNSLPASQQLLGSTVDISTFVASGGVFDATLECTFADGNGYLFVYHPSCDPSYVVYSSGAVTGASIGIQVRDFLGIPDGFQVNTRPVPSATNNMHTYNLLNQGWTTANPWSILTSNTVVSGVGARTFTVPAGVTGINPGDNWSASFSGPAGQATFAGTVTSYVGTVFSVNITSWSGTTLFVHQWTLVASNLGFTSAWLAAEGNYPSNADVWWYFKNTSGVFDPTVQANVDLSTGNAPKGHYLLNPFNQDRTSASGSFAAFNTVTTLKRPASGAWFQGRVWYTGLNDSAAATSTSPAYSWTESIYFSQIVQTTADFGTCFQTNDPTSENLFDLLPTDGGVIVIQGCGSINKLFPIQNGMLVHATNGIWFITGSQGIGFSANDYTVTKISNVQSISPTSFVNVNGLPYFWNEEGIYSVEPAQQGGLQVNPLTVGTILSFYNSIPKNSKQFARGDYHPIDYVIQWTYRSTQETSINDRYDFDTILNYNTYNKAFFPYTVSADVIGTPFINGVNYISYPQIGATVPDPGFKYIMSYVPNSYQITIADEHDLDYIDWDSIDGADYTSFFVTGYKLHGQGQRRFQIPYLYMYSRSEEPTSYKIQGLWDYATTGNSGRWSVAQLTNINNTNFAVTPKRHKIRGQGLVLQIKLTSVSGSPFDIIGWSTYETQNTGV